MADHISISASFALCQLCVFCHATFCIFFPNFCPNANMSPRREVCAYFLKCVRKDRFRNVWVGGGVLLLTSLYHKILVSSGF